jgi:tetratricopeptide (TPR) repeat protein
LLVGLAEQRLQHFDAMLAALGEAMLLRPGVVAVTLKYIEALLLCGEGRRARAELAALEGQAQDPRLFTAIAGLYTLAGAHVDRLRCARKALSLLPADRTLLASVAAAETACGEIEAAESHLDELLACEPQDYGAWYRRSVLRRQRADNNHVAALTGLLASLPGQATGVVPICYALAKECEDLGRYEQAFEYLQRGARQRRAALSYSVADDERVMQKVIACFDAGRMAATGAKGSADATAIFVMGLPRSGTTLVDRILSSHSAVHSLGEINDLAFAITALVGAAGDAPAGPGNRLELVERAAMLDPRALGEDYLRRVAGYPRERSMFIDKTPWNFLYLGLIALALPNARIIHLRRNPMDSCFALYKTLFRDGSPYSYDLDDLARYYLAYHALMQHWRNVLPGRFLEVDYEQLVASQETVTRELLAHCGLPFEAQCLEFHRNAAPAATASAAQVREPVHARSVQLWQRYAPQLAPLAGALRAGGLAVAGPG